MDLSKLALQPPAKAVSLLPAYGARLPHHFLQTLAAPSKDSALYGDGYGRKITAQQTSRTIVSKQKTTTQLLRKQVSIN